MESLVSRRCTRGWDEQQRAYSDAVRMELEFRRSSNLPSLLYNKVQLQFGREVRSPSDTLSRWNVEVILK